MRRAVVGVAVVVFSLAMVAVLAHYRDRDGAERGSTRDWAAEAAARPERQLSEARQARFVSLFLYDAEGAVTSYMAGSGTGEFDDLSAALADASPAVGAPDASYEILIIVSFGRDDTLDVSYSPSLNMLMVGEQAFAPAAELEPIFERIRRQTEPA